MVTGEGGTRCVRGARTNPTDAGRTTVRTLQHNSSTVRHTDQHHLQPFIDKQSDPQVGG